MDYSLLKDVVPLFEQFETVSGQGTYKNDIQGFRQWIADSVYLSEVKAAEPVWEGKENGRSPESIISTLILHMSRFAKMYSRSILQGTAFATQEEFIYLIVLQATGSMTKMELIKKNMQEKPAGMQIINRLIAHGWVAQSLSETDKRSRALLITPSGIEALNGSMDKIRNATRIISGDLTTAEKMDLIRLLTKLEQFHKPLFLQHAAGGFPAEALNDTNYLKKQRGK